MPSPSLEAPKARARARPEPPSRVEGRAESSLLSLPVLTSAGGRHVPSPVRTFSSPPLSLPCPHLHQRPPHGCSPLLLPALPPASASALADTGVCAPLRGTRTWARERLWASEEWGPLQSRAVQARGLCASAPQRPEASAAPPLCTPCSASALHTMQRLRSAVPSALRPDTH